MWHVVPHGASVNMNTDPRFETSGEAKTHAQALYDSFDHHYHVLKIQTVWTTKTLYEAMRENV